MGAAEAVRAVLWPALAAALVLGLAWQLHSRAARHSGTEVRPWAAPLAVALAAALGHALLDGWPWQPSESWRWLAWIAVAGGALGVLESANDLPALAVWLVRAVVLVSSVTLLAMRVVRTSEGSTDVARLAIDSAAALAGWLVFAPAVAAHGPRAGTILLWLAGSAVTAMVLFSGNLRVALLGGSVCAGLGSLAVGSWLRPSPRGFASAITPAALAFACLAVAAVELSYPGFSPIWYASVALAPVLGIALTRLAPIRSEPARSIARLVAALLALALGVSMAWRAYA